MWRKFLDFGGDVDDLKKILDQMAGSVKERDKFEVSNQKGRDEGD